MSISYASVVRRGVVAMAACLALVAPMGAQAGILNGLSVRGGILRSDSNAVRVNAGDVVWGGGLDYKLARFPSLFNGDQWSTSVSVDFHYAAKKNGAITRLIPVSINQVYTFDQEGKAAPYAGFFLSAATLNGTGQSTITRAGGGLIAGLDLGKKVYVETRYQWVDTHGLGVDLSGLYGYLGYRF